MRKEILDFSARKPVEIGVLGAHVDDEALFMGALLSLC